MGAKWAIIASMKMSVFLCPSLQARGFRFDRSAASWQSVFAGGECLSAWRRRAIALFAETFEKQLVDPSLEFVHCASFVSNGLQWIIWQ